MEEKPPTPLEADDPRKAASEIKKEKKDEYIYARQSSVPNIGEDISGSARHVRNAWRGLEEAEKAGTAANLVTRDQLFKNEPLNLMASIDERPGQAYAALAA